MTTPDEFTIPQPSGTVSWAQVEAKLVDYFLSNVMKTVWSVFLFVGGLIFFRYFFSIGFMPELDLQASLTLLAACTLLAGILFMSIISLSCIPALWWKSIGDNERLKALWYNDEKFALTRAILWVGLPFIGIAGGFICLDFFKWWGIAPLAVGLFMPSIVIIFLKKMPGNIPCILRWTVARTLLWRFLLSALAFFLLFSLVYLPFRVALALDTNALIFLLVFSVFVVVLNVFMSTVPIQPGWQRRSLIILPLLFIWIITSYDWLPNLVIRHYKFGNLPNASLVLNEMGCVIAQQQGAKIIPYIPDFKTNPSSNSITCSLPSVTIHSRLGNTYYLEVSHIRFTIPGQNVLSWAVNKSPKATTVGSSTSTQNPAPTTETTPPNKSMEPTR